MNTIQKVFKKLSIFLVFAMVIGLMTPGVVLAKKKDYKCTLSEYLSQSRFKMRLKRNERDKTGKAEITRDRANLTETILRVCDSNNEKNGQNFISVFEVMKNKRIIG